MEISHHQDGKIIHLQLTTKIGEILTNIHIVRLKLVVL
jgi:hypothetical protein